VESRVQEGDDLLVEVYFHNNRLTVTLTQQYIIN